MITDETARLIREADVKLMFDDGVPVIANLDKFAALVAAAEREACAKVCDDKAKETFSGQCQVWGDYFARVIRARGEKK